MANGCAILFDLLDSVLNLTANESFQKLISTTCSYLQILDPAESIAAVNDDYWQLRAEFIPEEELHMQEGDRLLPCYHISRVGHLQYVLPFVASLLIIVT